MVSQTPLSHAPAGGPTRSDARALPGAAADGGTEIESLPFPSFVWGAGMECSFLPHLNVDQFEWTQHDRFWRQDLRLAREQLGITHLRYAFPWHVLEPKRGTFNWAYADERIEEFEKLGITPLMDVMHFGTPLWLKQAVGDPEFPESLESFTEALVSRYGRSVKTWCPFNEPLVSALFSGDFGFWPPHSRKWRGYMPVLSRIVQAVSRGIRAIRRAAPEANVLLCDAAENYKTRVPSLQKEVNRRNLRRFLVMDLLTGRVDQQHPLYHWLHSYGMSDLDMAWFRANPQFPDVLGLDYYPHSDWQLDLHMGNVRQQRATNPLGLYGVAGAYYQRYGLPLMLTETSVDGQPINREIWLENTIDHIRRLREEGVPMLGLIWWPMLDQLDWDGAMTHRIGKLHQVGLFTLKRQPDGTLKRETTPLVEQFRAAAGLGEERVGKLERIVRPAHVDEEQTPLATTDAWEDEDTVDPAAASPAPRLDARRGRDGNGESNGNGNGKDNGNGDGDGAHASAIAERAGSRLADPAPGLAGELTEEGGAVFTETPASEALEETRSTGRYGVVVFSHLRWGFVWQRPQQFLSRFARKHPILFLEEPVFDKPEGAEPDLQFHGVMPNVTVACPHVPLSWRTRGDLHQHLLAWAHDAIGAMNEDGSFDRPLLWYYSPMDSAWSLGHFENRGIVYDAMDELSQFTGAPKRLVDNERRLMEYADVVFTGGFELFEKKRQQHPNVHAFGCGVEFSHFAKANDPSTAVPPDIDFMKRPILGWFGVVDERVDYAMVGEMARMRPEWSFAMVGPVVKIDPSLLPVFPNLYWLGGRDYQVLPNYCKVFDVNMMCFAINAATQYINPTKGLEYMATGKPIVSTPVRDVVRQWSDIVHVARTAEEFVMAAQNAMQNPDRLCIQRGIELASRCSWESTVSTMQGLIRDAIARPDRPSKRKITPLTHVELSYQFQPTQGS